MQSEGVEGIFAEGNIKLEDGTTSSVEPFREAEACWDHMEHVKVDKYHVSSQGEHELRYRREAWAEKNKAVYRMFQVWDADVQLDEQRIGDMVASALGAIAQ